MMVRIFRHFVPASIVLLAICELLLVFFTWQFYFGDHSLSSGHLNGITRSPALFLSLLAGAVMALSGLYHNKAFADTRVMLTQVAITFGILALLTFAWGLYVDASAYSWQAVAEALVTCACCVLVTRTLYSRLIGLRIFTNNVLVLGAGRKADRIAALARTGSNRHFVAVGYLSCGGSRTAGAAAADEAVVDPGFIVKRARELGATEVVVATDDRRGLPVKGLLQCRAAGIRVLDYLDFIERQTKTVDLGALQPGWLIFSDGFRRSVLTRACKRTFDVLVSLGLLVLTLPLMLLASLLIALESPGPVLYRQERVGLGGRTFVLLKFRSMRADAEKDGAPRWASTRDPRVTRVGAIIRKIRVDELPQLLNVLRGDMSLVGPRPERPAFVDEFTGEIPFYAERHCVKPGITGWAQINYPYGASLEDARNKLTYDLYYAKNHSLFLDLVIMLQTVRVILWADGAR